MTIRYQQLDSLRGIAALTVVLSHFSLIVPTQWLAHVPWRALAEGHSAVILFFALSGFVLTLQTTSSSRPTYVEFVVKRVCRIYLPYLVAVAVAYSAYVLLYRGSQSWTGDWVNAAWQPGTGPGDLMRHVYFLAPFRNSVLDPVLWSLVYEMRISLLFPFLVIAIFRLPGWLCLAISIAISGGAFGYEMHLQRDLMTASTEGDWVPTAHYMLMFCVGALIARHRDFIEAKLSARAPWTLLIALVVSTGVYALVRVVDQHLIADGVLRRFVDDWVATIAVTAILSLAIAFRPFANALSVGPLAFLGKISYSLYLLHGIVLLGVIHLCGERFHGGSLLIAATLILPVSVIGYYAVEEPSIQLGRFLTRRRAPVGLT